METPALPVTAKPDYVTTGETIQPSHLPEGSTIFQEVMAELSPHPEPVCPAMSPAGTRRKSSVGVSQVDVSEDKEESEGTRKVKEKSKHILHGLCHCYIVDKGEVTALADYRCNHSHPKQPSDTLASPRPQRKLSTGAAPDGAPRSYRTRDAWAVSNTHARPAGVDDFRHRTHSDTSAVNRPALSTSQAAASGPAQTQFSASGLCHKRHSVWSRSSSEALQAAGHVTVRRASSFKHVRCDIASSSGRSVDRVGSSALAAPPGGAATQETADPTAQDEVIARTRRSSTHAVASQDLRYLYDQFLPNPSDAVSAGEKSNFRYTGQKP